jgi:FkbM family methyltransferase
LHYFNYSFAQEGEDMVLARFLGEKIEEKGFYIDVGAHHPILFSNTYKFYLNDWRGINIDAMPGSMKLFNKVRPHDINLELAISDSEEILTYYIYSSTGYNTFSKEQAELCSDVSELDLVEKKEIQTYTLAKVLDTYLPENTVIDFMTIDVEGFDLHVLRSNNWKKYKPSFLLVESLGEDMESIGEKELYI